MADNFSRYQPRTSAGDLTRKTPIPTIPGSALSAQQAYIKGLDNMMNAGGKVVESYFTAIENRNNRDASTNASKIFRDRFVNTINSVKGKDADGLLDKEDEWQQEAYLQFLKDNKVSPAAGKLIWNKEVDQYLNKVGAYQIGQQQAYDKSSRLAASGETIDKLAASSIGDMTALSEAFAQNAELFKDDPNLAALQNDRAITVAVKGWARQNPHQAIKWFKENRAELMNTFGKVFIGAADQITAAENRLLTEAKRVEILAKQAQAKQDAEDKQYNKDQMNAIVSKAIAYEMGDPNTQPLSPAEVYAFVDDPRVSATNKQTFYNIITGMAKAEESRANTMVKNQQNAVEASIQANMYQTGFDDSTKDNITQELAKGSITAAQARALMDEGAQLSKPDSQSSNQIVKDARDAVKRKYIPESGFFGSLLTPEQHAQYVSMNAMITERIRTSPKTLVDDLNLLNPDSWVNKMFAANAPVKVDIATTFNQSGQVGIYQVNMPDSKGSRRPGESLSDFFRRTEGKQ